MPSFSRETSVDFWYRVDQERKSLLEPGGADRAALIVPKPHHHQLVRRNDERGLAACAAHVVRLRRRRKYPVPIDPKETTVDWTVVRFPGWCQRAHELRIALRQNPLAVPDAVLQIEITEASPVTRGQELVPLGEKVPEGIRFE